MFQGKLWNFRSMMKSSVPTKRISRIFDIGDLRSGHLCDFPIISQWAKKSTPLYLLSRKPIWVESYRIGQLRTIRVKICIAYPSKGHLRSTEVTNRHLPITFDQKEIETWDWCQYVRFGQANRLICNMTNFDHHVTLAWLDLRSNFDLDLAKSFYIWLDAPQRDKHDGIKIVALPSKLKILSSKKSFWIFFEFGPLEPSILTIDKKWPKWFGSDFSRALERCLSIFSTATRSRNHGGGRSNAPPPPPSRRWKKETQQGAGYITHMIHSNPPSVQSKVKQRTGRCFDVTVVLRHRREILHFKINEL